MCHLYCRAIYDIHPVSYFCQMYLVNSELFECTLFPKKYCVVSSFAVGLFFQQLILLLLYKMCEIYQCSRISMTVYDFYVIYNKTACDGNICFKTDVSVRMIHHKSGY